MLFSFSIIIFIFTQKYCLNLEPDDKNIVNMTNILIDLLSKEIIKSINRTIIKTKLANDQNLLNQLEECKKAFDIFDIENNDEQKEKLRQFYIYLLFSQSSKSKNDLGEYIDCIDNQPIDITNLTFSPEERKEIIANSTYSIFRIIENKNKSLADFTLKDNEYLFGLCIKKGCSEEGIKALFKEFNEELIFFENLNESIVFTVNNLDSADSLITFERFIPVIFSLIIVCISVFVSIINGCFNICTEKCSFRLEYNIFNICNNFAILRDEENSDEKKRENSSLKILRGIRGIIIISIVISTTFFYIYHLPTKVFSEYYIERILNHFTFPLVYHGERFGKKILFALSGFELVNKMLNYFIEHKKNMSIERAEENKEEEKILFNDEDKEESDKLNPEDDNKKPGNQEDNSMNNKRKMNDLSGDNEDEDDDDDNKIAINSLLGIKKKADENEENEENKKEEDKNEDILGNKKGPNKKEEIDKTNKTNIEENKMDLGIIENSILTNSSNDEKGMLLKEVETNQEYNDDYENDRKDLTFKDLMIWYLKQFYKYILYFFAMYFLKYGTIFPFMLFRQTSPIWVLYFKDISRKFTHFHILYNLLLISPFSHDTYYWINAFGIVYNEITYFLIGSLLIFICYKKAYRLDLIILISSLLLFITKIILEIFVFFDMEFYPAMFYQYDNLYVKIKNYLLSNQLINLNVFLLGMFFGEIYYCIYEEEKAEDINKKYLIIPRIIKNEIIDFFLGNTRLKIFCVHIILLLLVSFYIAVVYIYEIFIHSFLKDKDNEQYYTFFLDKTFNIIALFDGDVGVFIFFVIIIIISFNKDFKITKFFEHKYWRIISKPYWSVLLTLHISAAFATYYSENRIKLILPSIIFLSFEILTLLILFSSISFVFFEMPLKKINKKFISYLNSDKIIKKKFPLIK